MAPRAVPTALLALGALGLAFPPVADAARGCRAGMVAVFARFCVDAFEAQLDEVNENGRTLRLHSPFEQVDGKRVRARSRKNVVPQAHVSRNQAHAACTLAGKRLCSDDEWKTACRGRTPTLYPYGAAWQEGRCNDRGVSPLGKLHGKKPTIEAYGFEAMNDPRLNQIPGSIAKTAHFTKCRNSFGAYDMVGNLHEWTAAEAGTFRGGFYLDTTTNGRGCDYATHAHGPNYRDYSTGFRCCEDLATSPRRRRTVENP